MNRNDIRSGVIGVAAGATVFGALVAWVEFDPRREIADWLACQRLSPQERAELERIAAESAARDEVYRESSRQQRAEREERWDAYAEKFDPQRLITADSVHSVEELETADLVAEIVHAQRILREQGWSEMQYGHCDALYGEWCRRDHYEQRYKLPRVDQLRHDIFRAQVEPARNAPWTFPSAPRTEESDSVEFAYPDFAGPVSQQPDGGAQR